MLEAQPAALAAAKRLMNADDAAQVERAMRRERAASDKLRKR